MPFDPKHLFVIRLYPVKSFTCDIIEAHVAHLGRLDDAGRFVLGGPLTDGSGGMVVIRAEDEADARRVAESDPFVAEGFETLELRALESASRDNGYLLG